MWASVRRSLPLVPSVLLACCWARDFTFLSYTENPAFVDVVPVVTATVQPGPGFFTDFYPAYVIPDRLVSLDGQGLTCGNQRQNITTFLGIETIDICNLCQIQQVTYKPRKDSSASPRPAPIDGFNFQCDNDTGRTYLTISMQYLNRDDLYDDLDMTTIFSRRRLLESEVEEGGGAAEVVIDGSILADSSDLSSLEGSSLGHHRVMSRYLKQVDGAVSEVGPSSSSMQAHDAGIPSGPILLDTNKRQQQEEGPLAGHTVTSRNISILPPAGARDERHLASLIARKNFVISDFTYTYTIQFLYANGQQYTIDVTVVPLIRGPSRPVQSVTCSSNDNTASLFPKNTTCSNSTSRPYPYAIEARTFSELHPEEDAWVNQRLLKTAPSIQQFVVDKLGQDFVLTEDKYQLKVAMANSGGGKRATVYSFGVAKALYDLGVMDHASWVAGLSGGSWFLSSWYAAMFNATSVIDPEEVFQKIKLPFLSDIFPVQFNGNQALTNYLGKLGDPTFNVYQPIEGRTTGEVLCEANLKMQHPLTDDTRSATWNEFWSRSLARQLLYSNDTKFGLHFSEFADSPLLSTHSAPLPLIAVQENRGDGTSGGSYHLWDVTPFDISTSREEERLGLSFPTALLGSTPGLNKDSDVCIKDYDELSFLFGISSYATGVGVDVAPIIADIVCGSGPTNVCQTIPVANPFQNISSFTADTYEYTRAVKDKLYLADVAVGGRNVPLWSFVSTTRTADIAFVVDSSSQPGDSTNTAFSQDTMSPTDIDGKYQCTLDREVDCPDNIFGLNTGINVGPNFYSDSASCCDVCGGPFAFAGGCYPSFKDSNSAFNVGKYSKFNSLPPLPTSTSERKSVVNRITIFGCDNVSNSTSIVYMPNRIIRSGLGGWNNFVGSYNFAVPGVTGQQISLAMIEAAFENAKVSIPDKLGLSDFPTCLACLYYAKALQCDSFMSSGGVDVCTRCYDEYCFQPSSLLP